MPMQYTAEGRAMGGPTRSEAASASSSRLPWATAARARSTPSPVRNAPSMSAVTGRRSSVRCASMTTGISAPAAPRRANLIWVLSVEALHEHLSSQVIAVRDVQDSRILLAVDSRDIGCLCSGSPRKDVMSTIVSVDTRDIRFPTSLELDGSDAMNPDPDYSAAYVVVGTDAADGLSGHAFVFTIGRGNDVEVAALTALKGYLLGRDV